MIGMNYFEKRKGMTLVEVMVSITILVLSMGGFSLLYLRSLQSNSFILESGLVASTASRGVDLMVDELRGASTSSAGAYPLVSGSDFDVVFYANIDSDDAIERVHYYLNATTDTMYRGVTDPDMSVSPATYASGDGVTTTVATYATNETNQPVFTYYDKNYPSGTTTPLTTPVSVASVRLVKVLLRINIDPIKAPNNINIESFTELRNLNDY